MTKLVLRRKGATLYAPSQDWADLMAELPEGVDLNVNATRARSLRQNGTYWGLLSFVLEHGPEWMSQQWPDKDHLSDALQLECGFVRQVKLGNGYIAGVPQSKSFDECPQELFNKYMEKSTAKLTEWCGYDPLPLYFAWMGERRRSA